MRGSEEQVLAAMMFEPILSIEIIPELQGKDLDGYAVAALIGIGALVAGIAKESWEWFGGIILAGVILGWLYTVQPSGSVNAMR